MFFNDLPARLCRALPRAVSCVAPLALLAACTIINAPLNHALPPEAARAANAPIVAPVEAPGSLWIGLAFSGGGTRASAFAHGVLEELRAQTASAADPDGVLSEVRLVTGVSGGSVTAAYFGLYGPEGVDGYRDRYLVQDAERYMMNSPANPLAILRGFTGGANGRNTFARYLDESLFHGATFGDLARRSRVRTWINATDVAHQTTFLFTPETFDALCSDLSRYPISDAVAASAAYPLVFAPITVEAHRDCAYREPDWLTAARHNPEATGAMRAHAVALENYASADDTRFVKLLDGGITDNFGTTGLAVERARAQVPYAPLSAEQAVRLERLLFLVADAGVERPHDWTHRLAGPGGISLARSIAASAMAAASRTGFDAMRLQLEKWQTDLVAYRCALPLAEVARLRGTAAGWDCRNMKFFIGRAGFDALPETMRRDLNAVPTRLRLPEREVDLAIEAGRLATRQHPEVLGFLAASDAARNPLARIRQGGPLPRRIAPLAP